MKRLMVIVLFCALALILAACGNADDPATKAAAIRDGVGTAQIDAPLLSDAEVTAVASSQSAQGEATEAKVALADRDIRADKDRPVELDLTKLSGTVVYSQVYDMMMEPENYMGQKIKMRGSFSYFRDPDTQQEYFAAVIADATACCAQGIEFVWKGKHSYPQDYPPLDTEITVTGTFSTYHEGEYMYVQLTDADVSW